MKHCWPCSYETDFCSVCGVLYHDVLDGEGLGIQHALR